MIYSILASGAVHTWYDATSWQLCFPFSKRNYCTFNSWIWHRFLCTHDTRCIYERKETWSRGSASFHPCSIPSAHWSRLSLLNEHSCFLLLLFSVVFPIMFSFALAFTNYDLYHSPPANLIDWVGIKNFQNIFSIDIWRDTFIDVLGWTVVWTLAASTLQCAVGIFLAVLLNQKDLKENGFQNDFDSAVGRSRICDHFGVCWIV